ncbi:MAG: ImmA/IrrE family metallo-endopeptidase, partial [Candidatus Acidiferrales bacterium]
MLQQIIEATGLEVQTCAALLGVSPRLFGEWIAGKRPLPYSMANVLSAVVGVDAGLLLAPRQVKSADVAEITPAIWFKFRGDQLVDADRECVFLVRRLGYFLNELEEVTGKRSVAWKPIFEAIRKNIDTQAPPRIQGRQAAKLFRESTGLAQGATGVGDVLRGNLRALGVLVIETPLPESKLEGCSFYAGPHQWERPCVFANLHHSTWFRRNVVLMHEVGHAIFDAESAGASLDFVDPREADELAEHRAQAFSQEVLAPKSVLRHVAQANGLKWDSMSAQDLAIFVAKTQVEKKTLLEAAVEAELVTQEEAERYIDLDISPYLPDLTSHALSTAEYISKIGKESQEWVGKRGTTIPSRNMRLSVGYVNLVLSACREGEISPSKAAEMLLIDE